MKAVSVAVILVGAVDPAMAHGSSSIWSHAHWNADPWILVPLLISAVCYGVGVVRVWSRAGRGHGVRTWQAACFAAGWWSLVIALLSPLDWFAGRLFVAHMIEHEIVMIVAAPLIAISRPWGAMIWAVPHCLRPIGGSITRSVSRSRLWRWLITPLVATILHAVALWAWHVPSLYNAVLVSEAMHRLQHMSFFGAAVLFWWAMVNDRSRQTGYAASILCLFVTMMHSGTLGVLLTFSRTLWYPAQGALASQLGLTPLEDQQLAGLVMWVPVGLVYLAAAITLAGISLHQIGERSRLRDPLKSAALRAAFPQDSKPGQIDEAPPLSPTPPRLPWEAIRSRVGV